MHVNCKSGKSNPFLGIVLYTLYIALLLHTTHTRTYLYEIILKMYIFLVREMVFLAGHFRTNIFKDMGYMLHAFSV